MDLALLINKYLSDKQELNDENDSFNLVDDSIFRWDFKNVPRPTIEELQSLQPIVELEQLQAKTNSEALDFLKSTDWMVIRAAERGEELSPEFKAERQAARDRIVK